MIQSPQTRHVYPTSKTSLSLRQTLQPESSHNGAAFYYHCLTYRLFMTPNMQNDGHDTTVDYAGNWSRSFITPLLNNTKFMNKTLLILTFDENETYTIKNNVWAILLGDVIPPSLRGTTDDTVYTHYSNLATIQNNWGLYHLGRGDVNGTFSNVFQILANKTGYQNQNVTPDQIPYFNFTASGYFDTSAEAPIPALNETAVGAGGKGILPSLKGTNGSAIPVPPPSTASAGTSGSGSASGSAASASGSKSAAIRQFNYSIEGMMGLMFVFMAFSIGFVVV
jgi:Phosphoesterase family